MPAKVDGAKTAAKFRTMAEAAAKKIADLRTPRDDNTPKRNLQRMCRRIEADHMGRVKVALERLADAHEAGTVPEVLATIKNKAELMTMLATRTDHPSYYVVTDTGVYHDTSERAVKLRAFLDAAADPKAAADKAAADALFAAENRVKFLDIPGFFPTPPDVIAKMLDAARTGGETLSYLEPSAGKGDIVDAIAAAGPFTRIATYEINYTLRELLKVKGVLSCGEDFLAAPVPATETERFDRVLMNPPFEKGADIDHVRHAAKFLKDGGRLVSIMSVGPFYRSDAKAVEFRDWFDRVGGEKTDLPEGAFKDAFRSTGTRVVMVVIDR